MRKYEMLSFNKSLRINSLTGCGARDVKSWQATGTRPNGCLIAADNGRCRLSGGPQVMFNTRRATQTGCYSFVHQFRAIESHRGCNKRIISIHPPYSMCWEEVLKAKKRSAPVKQLHMLIHAEQTYHCLRGTKAVFCITTSYEHQLSTLRLIFHYIGKLTFEELWHSILVQSHFILLLNNGVALYFSSLEKKE